MITSEAMVEMLRDVEPGAVLFVSYLAGHRPTERAIREARKADNEGYCRRWFLGRLESKRTTRAGDPVITILTTTRYREDHPGADGNYRTFNARTGCLLGLEVIL